MNIKDLWNTTPKEFLDIVNATNPAEDLWNSGAYSTPAAKQLQDSVSAQSKEYWDSVTDYWKTKLGNVSEKAGEIAEEVKKTISGNGAGSGSGSGTISVSATKKTDDMQRYLDMINSVTEKNNAWAADQAQKQMDFQKMMSDTAHQREIADLQAAGLNPVLSATGGNGASTPAGASASPDTNNSNIIGQIAMSAIENLGNTATGLAYGAGSKNGILPWLKNLAGTLIPYAGKQLIRLGIKQMF